MSNQYDFDWSDLAFASKKPLKDLKATFIAAPREISAKRFTQFVKEHLPTGNVVLGIAKEDYVQGFEDQPQFRTLKIETVQSVVNKVNASASKNKVYVLQYFQRELLPILEKISFKQAVFVNGSWQYAFHNNAVYYQLVNNKIPYRLVSPFFDEAEAKIYSRKLEKQLAMTVDSKKSWSQDELLVLAEESARKSFDNSFQTGAVLAKKSAGKYKLLVAAHNKVVPYETYAMHFGASRETNFSPPHDLNHYDTVHAEVELILNAARSNISLKNTSLFINLLPCPTCARMLCETEIGEVVYQNDHSEGYAVKLLELAGKKVRRVVI